MACDPRFYQKPVVILQANSTSKFASESLREVLFTMSANVIDAASKVIPLSSSKISVEDIISNDEWRQQLIDSFDTATSRIETQNK